MSDAARRAAWAESEDWLQGVIPTVAPVIRHTLAGLIASREWAAREQCIAEHAAINKLTGDQQHQLERIYDAARADIPGEDKHQLAVRIMRLASKPPEAPLTMGTYEGFKGSD